MARPRKDPSDPKWAAENVGTSEQVPAGCATCSCNTSNDNGQLMLAVLMAGFLARGGPISYDTMLRQAKELVEMIKTST